jgi:hypothetical protein
LTENLRASTKLVKITSDVFYGGLMVMFTFNIINF